MLPCAGRRRKPPGPFGPETGRMAAPAGARGKPVPDAAAGPRAQRAVLIGATTGVTATRTLSLLPGSSGRRERNRLPL